MVFRRTPRHRLHDRDYVRPLVIGLVIVASMAALWVWLAGLGPQRVEEYTVRPGRQDAGLDRLSAEVGRLEADYQRLLDAGLGHRDGGPVLREALAKQRELVRALPEAPPEQITRLQRLESAMDTHLGLEINERIERLEEQAAERLARSDRAGGHDLLVEALTLQRQINATRAAPRLKNFSRESALRQQVDSLEVAPLAEERAAALVTAREAVEAESWGLALAAYIQARDIQRRINEDYPRTPEADLAAAESLEREIATLNAGGVAAAVDVAEAAGNEALTAGDMVAASRHYAEAQARQIEINRLFARSRFVSAARVEELEVKRQTAMSTLAWERLLQHRDEIMARLRRRQVAAVEEELALAVRLAAEVFEAFPRSRLLDPGLRNHLVYLDRRRAELRELQDLLHDTLQPLPGIASRRLMRVEISQALYQRIMATNPSRQQGPALPVDSVNHHEARECADRVSWVLGWPARLPTWDEYRIAVGDPETGEVWSRENARQGARDTGSAAANDFGYHDLLGNVAEWLADPGTLRGGGWVAGGSWLDHGETLRKVPREEMPRGERARHVGFRLVVVME
jgi:hypothetical protein